MNFESCFVLVDCFAPLSITFGGAQHILDGNKRENNELFSTYCMQSHFSVLCFYNLGYVTRSGLKLKREAETGTVPSCLFLHYDKFGQNVAIWLSCKKHQGKVPH